MVARATAHRRRLPVTVTVTVGGGDRLAAMSRSPCRVLILGATSAIAQEIARQYGERGARLYLVGRDPEKLAALTKTLDAAVVGSAAADRAVVAGACPELD